MRLKHGWIAGVEHIPSPHCDDRPESEEISLLVVHNISLPPGKFGGDYISQLFTGTLLPDDDPYFAGIYQLRVAAHCLIRRDGKIIQYVPFNKRAWHAGISNYKGRAGCNDFSVGIELEGTDTLPFTDEQYQSLVEVSALLMKQYAITPQRVTGHSDIAPGRKTDPGPEFIWSRYYQELTQYLTPKRKHKRE